MPPRRPTKREMINSVHAQADRWKATHATKNKEFTNFAPAQAPRRGVNPFGRARRRFKADQIRIAKSPAIQTALQAWKDTIETERTALVNIVNTHNRRPDARELANAERRIKAKKDAALDAIATLEKEFRKIRGSV